MKDVDLWRSLRQPELDPERLLPWLAELVAGPAEQRFGVLGALPAALESSDPRIRAAATGALAGLDGLLALQAIVTALDDPDANVRRTAVLALEASTHDDPARFVHALFHRRGDVRATAVTSLGPPGGEWMTLFLLADPECRDLVLARDDRFTPPASFLGPLFEMLRQGWLTPATARPLVARMSLDDLLEWIGETKTDKAELLREVLVRVATATSPEEVGASRRELDVAEERLSTLLTLFCGAVEPEEAEAVDRFWRLLRQGVGRKIPAKTSHHIARSLLDIRARGLAWPDGATVLLVFCMPEALASSWLEPEVRRRAIEHLYLTGSTCPRITDVRVRRLLELGPFRRPDGRLDLHATGGLLHLLQAHPFKKAIEWLGLENLVTAFLADFDDGISLLRLHDGSSARLDLLRAVCTASGELDPEVFARVVWHSAAHELELLRELDGAAAIEVFEALCDLAQGHGTWSMSERKLVRLGDQLVERLVAPGGVRGLLSRAARALATRRSPEERFVDLLIERPDAASSPLAMEMLALVARRLEAGRASRLLLRDDPDEQTRLLAVIAGCPGFPWAKERALAEILTHSEHEALRAWARAHTESVGTAARYEGGGIESSGVRKRGARDRQRIASCPEADLDHAIERCLREPCRGLAAALAERPEPSGPRVEVCVALLACHDPLDQVDAQFHRFSSESRSFLEQLDRETVHRWLHNGHLPFLGNAWLFRWDRHLFALGDEIAEAEDGLVSLLATTGSLRSAPLRACAWQAVAWLLRVAQARARERLAIVPPERHEALLQTLDRALETDVGEWGAAMLVVLLRAGLCDELLAELRTAVTARLPAFAPEVRRRLAPWISSRGLSAMPVSRRTASTSRATEPVLARVRSEDRVDRLLHWASGGELELAEEATLRLVDLAAAGHEAARIVGGLCRLLLRNPPVPVATAIAATISLWPRVSTESLELLADRVRDGTFEPELRFVVGVGLWEHGLGGLEEAVLAAVLAPAERAWFGKRDWERLLALGVEARRLAEALAPASQPMAYATAVDWLLSEAEPDERVVAPLLAFLAAGSDRLTILRVRAAWRLLEHGHSDGFPVLLAAWADQIECDDVPLDELLVGRAPGLVAEATTGVLLCGTGRQLESRILDLLTAKGVDEDACETSLRRLLVGVKSDASRALASVSIKRRPTRDLLLRTMAESFAWGVKRGRELVARRFVIKPIVGKDLGYTLLDQRRIWVNPLPILRREKNGREVVEALILHELGHHMYHSGSDANEVWEEAREQRIFSLLNLVSDEHLERNLRSLDAGYGDKLKLLGSYAFRHSQNETAVMPLLGFLGARAFDVLSASRLGVARTPGCVALQNGKLMLEIERAGMSFGRFVRALRLGLGNRHSDPRVAEALELFQGDFRQASMRELLAIAYRLREIFGDEIELLDCFGQDAALRGNESDLLVHGEGITDGELEDEIRRILDPGEARGSGPPGGPRTVNVGPRQDFDPITTVEALPFDPAAHREYASQVARQSRQMRRYLEELGIRHRNVRHRVRGHRFDPSRTAAVVTRRDPRILVARETHHQTDLFIGVLIDCSGSMAFRDHHLRAKLFAVMLAEAARGHSGIDVRFFGFTDTVIWDAGNADRCAVHALEIGGGNNDAAALWHAAQEALRSRRKARLLVMISDGLPTECSVDALRELVTRLSRRLQMCCAQVAVAPLEEICFPHYVLLDDEDSGTSVRRFGTTIARLVRRTLG